MAEAYWIVLLKKTHIVKTVKLMQCSPATCTVSISQDHIISALEKHWGSLATRNLLLLFFFFLSLSSTLFPTATTTTSYSTFPSYRKSKQPLCFDSGALLLLENKSKPFLFWWCSLICVDELAEGEGPQPERWRSLSQWDAGTPLTRSNAGLLLVVTGLPLARLGRC